MPPDQAELFVPASPTTSSENHRRGNGPEGGICLGVTPIPRRHYNFMRCEDVVVVGVIVVGIVCFLFVTKEGIPTPDNHSAVAPTIQPGTSIGTDSQYELCPPLAILHSEATTTSQTKHGTMQNTFWSVRCHTTFKSPNDMSPG